MGGIASVFYDGFTCPFTTLLILSIIWIWVKNFYGEVDCKEYTVSYQECVKKQQWWRVLTSPLCHSSPFHLFVNVTALWTCRTLEKLWGIWFYFRYTLLIVIAEAVLSLLFLQVLFMVMRNRATEGHPLANINILGSSGIVLAWLAYASLDIPIGHDGKEYVAPFFLLGVIPIPWIIAPLFMMIMMPMVIPRESAISNMSGVLCGYLLYSGVIAILPDWYWSISFFVDVAMFVIITSANSQSPAGIGGTGSRAPPRSILGGDEEVLEVIQWATSEDDGIMNMHSIGTSRNSSTFPDPEDGDSQSSSMVERDRGEEIKTEDVWRTFDGDNGDEPTDSTPLMSDARRPEWVV